MPAVIDPDGAHAYFGTTPNRGSPFQNADDHPTKIVKLALTRPPKPELAAAPDAYPRPYLTPLSVAAPGVLGNDRDTEDNDPLTAHDASDPAGGSVSLNGDGSFTYTPDAGFSGTDTFTYVASDGRDYSAPATVSITVGPPPDGVSSVTGSAYGYYTNVSLFGGPYGARGPAPTVALKPNAANSPQSAHVDSAEAVYGPAVIFRSGPIDVAADATLGPGGHARSSSTVQGHPDPTQRPGPFLYDAVASACRADEAATAPTVSVTNGIVETSYHVGDDPSTPEVEQGGDVKTTQAVPAEPPPGYVIEGTIDHVGDRFRIVFNEQTANRDGSRTVVGAHMELLGPTAVGDVVIAQSVCGVSLTPGSNRPPAAADDAYGVDEDATLTVAAPGVLANDADPDGDALTAGSPSDPAGGAVVLNPDGSFTYTPDAGFTGTDSFTYVATDPAGAAATATVVVSVAPPPGADLSVRVSDDPDPAEVRAEITYTVTVANTGPDAADAASVLVKLSGAKFVSASGAPCAVAKGKGGGGIRCELGAMPAGATTTITIVTQAPTRPATVSATATVSSATTDPDGTDNTATETTTVTR